jgi:hypothetical protein
MNLYTTIKIFPSAPNEEQGWWVGVATHVGDALTYKILSNQNNVIYWSAILSALDFAKHNQRLSPLGGETASTYLDGTMYICKTWMGIQLSRSTWLPLTQRI